MNSREICPLPDNGLEMAWIISVASLKDKVSWATLGVAGLLHAESVRYVSRMCSTHPTANFLLIISGIDNSIPATVTPWALAGLLSLELRKGPGRVEMSYIDLATHLASKKIEGYVGVKDRHKY